MSRVESTVGQKRGLVNGEAVVDPYLFKCFLSMAFKEGLIFEDTRKTDGFLSRLAETHYPDEVKEIVLEQFVLTPRLFSYAQWGEITEGFSGPLVDGDHFRMLTGTLPPIRPFEMPYSEVEPILQARGIDLTEEQAAELLAEDQEATEAEEEYVERTGKNLPSPTVRGVMGVLERLGHGNHDPHTEEEYAEQRQRNEAHRRAKPVIDALNDYWRVVQTAEMRSSLACLPTPKLGARAIHNPDQVPLSDYGPNSTVLFRLTAHELGAMSFHPTVKGCLQFAASAEMNSLRTCLVEWEKEMPTANDIEMKKILDGIQKAKDQADRKTGWARAGSLSTILGVPASIAGALLSGPLLTIGGLALSLVGGGAEVVTRSGEEKTRWLSLGSRSKN